MRTADAGLSSLFCTVNIQSCRTGNDGKDQNDDQINHINYHGFRLRKPSFSTQILQSEDRTDRCYALTSIASASWLSMV